MKCKRSEWAPSLWQFQNVSTKIAGVPRCLGVNTYIKDSPQSTFVDMMHYEDFIFSISALNSSYFVTASQAHPLISHKVDNKVISTQILVMSSSYEE